MSDLLLFAAAPLMSQHQDIGDAFLVPTQAHCIDYCKGMLLLLFSRAAFHQLVLELVEQDA